MRAGQIVMSKKWCSTYGKLMGISYFRHMNRLVFVCLFFIVFCFFCFVFLLFFFVLFLFCFVFSMESDLTSSDKVKKIPKLNVILVDLIHFFWRGFGTVV